MRRSRPEILPALVLLIVITVTALMLAGCEAMNIQNRGVCHLTCPDGTQLVCELDMSGKEYKTEGPGLLR